MYVSRKRLVGFALSHFDMSYEVADALAVVYMKRLHVDKSSGKKVNLMSLQMFCHQLLYATKLEQAYERDNDIDNYIHQLYEMIAQYRLKETSEEHLLELVLEEDLY